MEAKTYAQEVILAIRDIGFWDDNRRIARGCKESQPKKRADRTACSALQTEKVRDFESRSI